MKTTLFQFESPIGTFWIRPEPDDRVQLGIDRTLLRTYGSARAAAVDVANRATGYARWDNNRDAVAPRDLKRWKRGTPDRRKKIDAEVSRKATRGSRKRDEEI
jgi:hypothetical protein